MADAQPAKAAGLQPAMPYNSAAHLHSAATEAAVMPAFDEDDDDMPVTSADASPSTEVVFDM
jgi:hypothetical protein